MTSSFIAFLALTLICTPYGEKDKEKNTAFKCFKHLGDAVSQAQEVQHQVIVINSDSSLADVINNLILSITITDGKSFNIYIDRSLLQDISEIFERYGLSIRYRFVPRNSIKYPAIVLEKKGVDKVIIKAYNERKIIFYHRTFSLGEFKHVLDQYLSTADHVISREKKELAEIVSIHIHRDGDSR
jgi:hypothetical protein